MRSDEWLHHDEGNVSNPREASEYDDGAPSDHDGRSHTQTKFNPSEAPRGKRRRYRRLAKVHDGSRGLDQDERRSAQRRRDAAVFCNRLDCTDYVTDRVVHVIDLVDGDDYGTHTYEEITLAVIAAVVRRDGRWLDSSASTDDHRETFVELCESCGTTSHDIRELRQQVERELDVFDVTR